MSDQKEQLNLRILDAKERLAKADMRIEEARTERELIQRILSGSENRAYQGGSGGRGLMGIDAETAVACGGLGVEMKLNVNFTKSAVDTLTRRNFSKERDVLDLEREQRECRDEITRAQTEVNLLGRYQSVAVQAPVTVPQVAGPQWHAFVGGVAISHDGSDLPVGTLVSSDRGATWVPAETVGLAIPAPVLPPQTKKS